ncbi:MAG: dephospho-CoA kinase [Bacteroidetes bacterium]|nr:dephospho-CoA kinase [Bacteroidota bacterium]
MITAGLTGSMGSGKSIVASIFEHLGIPVYHADTEAKKFLGWDSVKGQLVNHFGDSILDMNSNIDRKQLASIVFPVPDNLQVLNSIIHPLVRIDFEKWLGAERDVPYVVQEAAILFESGFERFFDCTIAVTAPMELCIQRVMERDGISSLQVQERMKNQWDQEKKAAMADFILVNDGISMLLPQVLELHRKILSVA